MKKIIFASMREGAGKTSIITGISRSREKCGYIKPLGDRLVYKRKKNIDHDAMFLIHMLGMDADAESLSLGFSHSKLRYMYTEETILQQINEMSDEMGKGMDVLFIEGGRDLCFGASIHLDSISVARYVKGRLIIVVSGDSDQALDDLTHLHRHVSFEGVDFGGVIINKVNDVDDFKAAYQKVVEDMGIPILGIVPFKERLTHFTVSYLSDIIFAKVIAGEEGLERVVKNIFVGSMSTEESLRNPQFNKENKLLITSGDRSDMILTALESDTVGIVLTNNILPPSNIISKAGEKKIPLLMVQADAFHVVRQIDSAEALLTRGSDEKVEFLAQMVKDYVRIDEILK